MVCNNAAIIPLGPKEEKSRFEEMMSTNYVRSYIIMNSAVFL